MYSRLIAAYTHWEVEVILLTRMPCMKYDEVASLVQSGYTEPSKVSRKACEFDRKESRMLPIALNIERFAFYEN